MTGNDKSIDHGADPDREDTERTISGRPRDPNSLFAKFNFPPGVSPETAKDPGANTPEDPPPDNESTGKK